MQSRVSLFVALCVTFAVRSAFAAPPNEYVPHPVPPPASGADDGEMVDIEQVMARSTGGQPRVEVHFAPDPPDMTLLWAVRTGGAKEIPFRDVTYIQSQMRYALISRGPGVGPLLAGTRQLAISYEGRSPVLAPVVTIPGDCTIQAHYVDRRLIRIMGGLIAAAGVAGGTAMIVISNNDDLVSPTGVLVGGIAVVVASLGVGGYFFLRHDMAQLSVVPLAPAPAPKPAEGPPAPTAQVEGLALRVRF